MNRVPHVENGYMLIVFITNDIDFILIRLKSYCLLIIVTDRLPAYSNLGSSIFIRLLVIQLYATHY